MSEKIGFIGLGIMGRGMVHNLLKNGHKPWVWNRTASRAEELVKEGAELAESPADLAGKCEMVLICVSDTPDVEAVLFGEKGVAEGIRPGSLVVDMSTISPQATREIAARLKEQKVAFVDAPISGGSEGAAKGTLSIMAGGEAKDFERALFAFKAMGKTITHVGKVGDGQMVKLVNQILVAGSMLAMGEALLFAKKGGLDLEKTIAAIKDGAAGSWTLTNRGPQVLADDWRPGFAIDLQQKDLRLILQAADEIGTPTLGSGLAFNLYRALQAEGRGGEGNHALIKALEKLAPGE